MKKLNFLIVLITFCSQANADLSEELKGYCQRLNIKAGYIAQAVEKCNLSISYTQIHEKAQGCDTGLDNGERLRLMSQGREAFNINTKGACETARKIEIDYFDQPKKINKSKKSHLSKKPENINVIPTQAEPVTKNSDVPKFKDYPVDTVYTGEHHPLVLNKFGKLFKTRLSEAIKNEKPNFAGHYIVTGWGCGASCYSSAVIDVATGIAYPFPVTAISSVYPLKPEFANEDGKETIYHLNSSLLVLAGNLGDVEDTTQFYNFKDGEFVLLKSLPYGKKAQ